MQAQQPTPPYQPTEPTPIAQVNTGMRVIDAGGADVGTVSTVQLAGTGTEGHLALDLSAHDADRLLRTGYLRVDGGVLARDLFVEAGQVADVTEGAGDTGVVTLRVSKDELTRAG